MQMGIVLLLPHVRTFTEGKLPILQKRQLVELQLPRIMHAFLLLDSLGNLVVLETRLQWWGVGSGKWGATGQSW